MSFFAWLRKSIAPGKRSASPPDAERLEALIAVPLHAEHDLLLDGLLDKEDAACQVLALGNLFRAQGDIDRAVRLRERVLASPDHSLRGRAFFELGRDYRKAGFLDRALRSFKEAAKFDFPARIVGEELMRLHADSGDFASAATEAAKLGNAGAQAHYLVLQAREQAAAGNDAEAAHYLRHAVAAWGGSPEAWLSFATISLLAEDNEKALADMREGLAKTSDSGRLILLEGLYAFVRGSAGLTIGTARFRAFATGLADALAAFSPDITTCYYAGLFLHHAGDTAGAEQWYTKCLVLDPDFWAARLAILALAAGREALPALLADQIAFFTEQGARSKRFLCPSCGMRRETIFSLCPRCFAWHSAAFRLRLT